MDEDSEITWKLMQMSELLGWFDEHDFEVTELQIKKPGVAYRVRPRQFGYLVEGIEENE